MKKLGYISVIDLICRTVRFEESCAQIILYGSQVRGNARSDSDRDIIVVLDKSPMPYFGRYKTACLLRDGGGDIWEDKEDGWLIGRAFSFRQDCDYDDFIDAAEDDINQYFPQVKFLVKKWKIGI